MIFDKLFAVAFYSINQILNYNFVGNMVRDYLIALGVFVLTLFVLRIFEKVIIRKIKKFADHTKTDFDDLLVKIFESIGWSFYFSASLYLAFQFVVFSDIVEKTVFYIFLVIVAYYIVKSVQQIIDYGINKAIEKRDGQDLDSSAVNLLKKAVKVVLWAVAAIIVIQNFGYDVSSLVVGLGVGGIAIAFALQNILEDIFSSLSIYFDKPFKIGDFVVVGEHMGTIKDIGIKSTRIQALQGEEIVISNREMMASRIQNFKKLEKRRIVFKFGVAYETLTEKVEKIPKIIKEIIDKEEMADLDRVHFKEFGDFSLNFEVVYYIKSAEYIDYMNTQQSINLAMKQEFEKEKIEFAYPTQTIYLNKS